MLNTLQINSQFYPPPTPPIFIHTVFQNKYHARVIHLLILCTIRGSSPTLFRHLGNVWDGEERGCPQSYCRREGQPPVVKADDKVALVGQHLAPLLRPHHHLRPCGVAAVVISHNEEEGTSTKKKDLERVVGNK